MPRLLPQLLRALGEKARRPDPPPVQSWKRPRRRTQDVLHPLPRPSFRADGRTHSILLDDVNPIMHAERYEQPKLRISRNYVNGKGKETKDGPRSRGWMSEEEREWFTSPYLRMLSSPIRQDKVTDRYFPTDFLLRLAPMGLPSSRASQNKQESILIPDGIQHPSFRPRRSGGGLYVLCRRAALDELLSRGKDRRFGRASPTLAAHLGHLLRLRVLQELTVLAEQIEARKGIFAPPALRRLTRAEFAAVKGTDAGVGTVSSAGAVAILVVPPVNRDPTTRERVAPAGAFAEGPLTEDSRTPIRKTLPPSVLHPATADDMSGARVPLYNGVTLFPHRAQRRALHEVLCKVLRAEQLARRKSGTKADAANSETKEKSSHAFLLSSDTNTLQRVDTVPLAIALWRLRLWEGDPWADVMPPSP